MLGWEYPPFISGGLGTACEGLSKALSRLGVKITFVIPRLQGSENATHMNLVDPAALFLRKEAAHEALTGAGQTGGTSHQMAHPIAANGGYSPGLADGSLQTTGSTGVGSTLQAVATVASSTHGLTTIGIPAFLQPYWSEQDYHLALTQVKESKHLSDESEVELADVLAHLGQALTQGDSATHGEGIGPHSLSTPLSAHSQYSNQKGGASAGAHYGDSLFEEVARYTGLVLSAADNLDFDVIHAHDWMTFPAGVALAEKTGKPLIVHVHSLEYDRTGHSGGSQIHQFEQLGTTKADAVIAVSHYTKGVIAQEHGIPEEKIFVSHNGIYPVEALEHYHELKPENEKWVLFLGRITFQKGPDYFIEAAAKVIPHVPDAKFIVAGSGDMLPRLKARVEELGISDSVKFPGFLRGKAVEEAFSNADLYVMPSVSEPFGLAALEAINFDTPALISRQTGVSEVLGHTLKFDFWDVDRMADLIINALQFGELRDDMLESARKELSRIKWDASAERVKEVYERF